MKLKDSLKVTHFYQKRHHNTESSKMAPQESFTLGDYPSCLFYTFDPTYTQSHKDDVIVCSGTETHLLHFINLIINLIY